MAKIGRWIALALGALLCVLAVAAAAVYGVSAVRLGRTYDVSVTAVAISTDAVDVSRGRHLVEAITKCGDCHGETLSGKVFIDAPPFRIVGPNLTRGQGGIGARMQDTDWVRAIRHGVGRHRRALLVMPSEEYIGLTERDLADVIGYVKSVPAVDNTPPGTEFRFLGRLLLVAGQLPPPAAAVVDHRSPFPAPVAEGETPEYGRYLATVGGCIGCHGPGLSGGRVPGTPPEFPPAANITPAGAIGQWTEQDFFKALREGKRPSGAGINPFMPWQATAKMTNEELKALWLYLRLVPSRPYGNR